jgi:hypothetical protein
LYEKLNIDNVIDISKIVHKMYESAIFETRYAWNLAWLKGSGYVTLFGVGGLTLTLLVEKVFSLKENKIAKYLTYGFGGIAVIGICGVFATGH